MSRGFVLGKFLPPHNGHVFLCDFARHYVDELTILVCTLDREPIDGRLRAAWIRELFPACRVVHFSRDVPQEPSEHPDFWSIWRDIVKEVHPEPIDVVFASESYGAQLAAVVGARFVPVDPARLAIPVSGTRVRHNPLAAWRYLPAPVRAHFAKTVCVFGPESTGKTTLASALATHFETVCVPEFGRIHTETFGTQCNADDLRLIAKGHRAATAAARRQANRVVISDTDPLLTAVWADMLLGTRPPDLDVVPDLADLYLLCGTDMPWIDDGTRYFPDPARRNDFFQCCETELIRRNARYVPLQGGPDERLHRAISEVNRLMDP